MNGKVRFITPENEILSMPCNKALSYCEKICNQEQYKNSFLEFAKDYHYFSPYFDFVMFELHYIFINPLFNTGTYLGISNDALYLNKLEGFDYEKNIKSLQELAKEDTVIPYITRCSDKDLNIEKQNSDDVKTCMIDSQLNGMMSFTDVTGTSHGITSNTVLNQLVLKNSEVARDYYYYALEERIDKDLDPINYMIQRLGFLRAVSFNGGGFIIGNESIFTEEQKSFVAECKNNDYDFHNTCGSLSDNSSILK